ncbi:MAG: hypothetical protein ACPGXY_02405 [Alphaproteobacteria bacterium]
MPQLDVTTFASQIFWLFVCFTAIVVYMWKAGIPLVASILQARYERIEGLKRTADDHTKSAETMRAELEEFLAKAREEANVKIVVSLQDVAVFNAKRKREASDRLIERLRNAEKHIEKEKEKSMEGLKQIAGTIAQAAVEKLVPMEVDTGKMTQAINTAISEKVA